MQGYMKPMNWISPTGFKPCAAMPTHKPLISRLDSLLALGCELLLLRLAPGFSVDQIGPEPRDRFLLPRRLDGFGSTVARGVVRGGVIAQPIGYGLNESGSLAGACSHDS